MTTTIALPFTHDYIVTGDLFPDETVLCMRCGVTIIRLAYKEMSKIGAPKEMVQVAHKMKLGNYRQLPCLMLKRGKECVLHLQLCQSCVKLTIPEENSDAIVSQIVRATQIELRWAGYPDEAILAVKRNFADARILRKLTGEEALNMYTKER